MKKVYVFLMAFAVCATVFAQKMTYDGQAGSQVKGTRYLAKDFSFDATKATVDTAGWSETSIPLFTLGTLTRMGMIDANDNPIGYWFGTNGTSTSDTSSDYWAQAWTNFASIKISGILFLTGGKYNYSGSNSIW